MKQGFRQSMGWLHIWAGLAVGWVLFFIFLTGTLGYLRFEIDRWMMPERPLATAPRPAADLLPLASARLWTVAPDAANWTIYLPTRRTLGDLRIVWTGADGAASGGETLDPRTGGPEQLRVRDTGGGDHLYEMHYRLYYLPYDWAIRIVGICTMAMLVALLTGIVVHRRIFADFFTFRPRKGQRSWLDAHNLVGVTALPFHLMITYSGLIFFLFAYLPTVPTLLYGADAEDRIFEQLAPAVPSQVSSTAPRIAAPRLGPMLAVAEAHWGAGTVERITVDHPGRAGSLVTVFARSGHGRTLIWDSRGLLFDGMSGRLLPDPRPPLSAPIRLHDLLLDLHVADFAQPLVRLLYLISGLAGTAMIGTGLVLWSAKRKAKLPAGHRGLALVDRLNIATLVGLPVAIAGYFWANRLLPVDFAARHDWEVHCMFLTWLAVLLYSFGRTPEQGWRELFGLAAIAWSAIPLLNALTTDKHLGVTLAAHDWVLAGFDLTALAVGIVFALLFRRSRYATGSQR